MIKLILYPLSCIFALMAPIGIHAAEKTKPNILFCFADDWGKYAGCYAQLDKKPGANSLIQTPNLDQIASHGTIFRNAFVNAPSCTPCRSSLLSGRYFFNCGRGAILQTAQWDPKIPSYPLLLRDSGYHIGKTTKVWSPGNPVDAPFGGQLYAYQKAGMRHNNFSENVTAAMEKGESLEKARSELYAEVKGNFEDFLKAKPANQPFHYWFGPTTVHRSWVKGSGKKLWKIEPESLKGKLPGHLPDVPAIREDFADYLGEIQAFDAYVGELMVVLEQRDLLKNTIIVISGDHGAPGFPGGKCNLYDFGVQVALIATVPGQIKPRVVDDFVNLMDLCPTFLELAGVAIPQGVEGKSLVPQLMSDRSGQIDERRNYNISGRERHVAGARENLLPYPQRCYRTQDFLYIRNFAPDRTPMGDGPDVGSNTNPTAKELENNTFAAFADMDAGPTKSWLITNRTQPEYQWHYQYAFGKRPPEELYDLRKDPEQLNNVAGDSGYRETVKEYRVKLLDALLKHRDPRLQQGKSIFDSPPFTNPNDAKAKANPKK